MSNATRFVAALSLAGAMLAHSPASFAQQTIRGVYAAPVLVDYYYGVTGACNSSGAYASIGRRPYVNGASAAIGVPYDAYAAVNGFTTGPVFSRGLRAGDWTAIHGAARNPSLGYTHTLCHRPVLGADRWRMRS